MSLRGIQAGAVIRRAYFAVPEHYSYGPEFEDWDAAVTHAQARRKALVAQLTEALAGYSSPEQVAATADAQIRVDLRWFIVNPDGTKLDTPVESYRPVMELRTSAQLEAGR